jgi:predicted ATPase
VRAELPTGTVTFLFTDVEGSTKLLHSLGEHAYAEALADHRRLLRQACGRHGGVEVDTQGDAFFFAFGGAADALAAARESIAALEPGPIRVRIGVHTGTPLATDEGYVGVDVHRAARIAASGHGGQVLVSADTAAATGVDVALVDLGEHRLKDLAAAERIFQLGDATFPSLSTLSASNLPVPATAFLGREQELAALVDLLADPDVQGISVVGPGGIGKTRLAVQAAAEASTGFSGGVWWVALAPLTDPGDAFVELARALGVREREGVTLDDALHARLEGRRALILLDNAEHLLPTVASVAAQLLGLSSELKVLVTTRERLQLSSEHVFAVPTLAAPDAVALFRERAAAAGIAVDATDEVEELCERLDRLPLALQLAAARLRTFSPAQLLDRLAGRLDLLRTGLRDLEPRQRTLRATLEWSHELLSAEEQRLFARLSVFAGSHTLEAAEVVCGADADVLEAIADKSLVQLRDGPTRRFWMLESIHAFAAEQLNGADDLRRRHAAYFRELAEQMGDELRAGEPEEGPVSVLAAEIDNLRSSVEFGLETGDDDLVRTITSSLPMYWIVHGLYSEGRAWLDRALALGDDESASCSVGCWRRSARSRTSRATMLSPSTLPTPPQRSR